MDKNNKEIVICQTCGEIIEKIIEGHVCPVPCKCRREAIKARDEEEFRKHLEVRRAISIKNQKFRNFTFELDDGKDERSTRILKKYLEKFEVLKKDGFGLLLWGAVGTGKTFYAHAIANALIDKGYSVRSTSLAEMVSLAQDFENAETELTNILDNEVIILDDVGTERQTSFASEQIYQFINKATTQNKVLIITTNISTSEFEKAAQDSVDLKYARTFSRILEKCYPVKVNAVKRRNDLMLQNRARIKGLLDEN